MSRNGGCPEDHQAEVVLMIRLIRKMLLKMPEMGLI
jgi:hypothetical protein